MFMIIKSYLNCTLEEINAKRFNIFIGISLGNRYFSKENIKRYILWALQNTKDDVLVLIADTNQAINYEVFNSYTPERALQVAIRKSAEIQECIHKIIRGLPKDKQLLVRICTWEDVRKSKYYVSKKRIILDEFKSNTVFHDFVITIVKEHLGSRVITFDLKKLEHLALYLLDELPLLLNGLDFEGKRYTLHPYPGFSSLEDLLRGLHEGVLFPNFTRKLDLKSDVAEIEGYVD